MNFVEKNDYIFDNSIKFYYIQSNHANWNLKQSKSPDTAE